MTRYLVTGGAGFIGSHLVEALVRRGDRVLVLDDFSTGTWRNLVAAVDRRCDVVTGSVLDVALVRECMARTDRCFHLAASVGVGRVVAAPLQTFLDNVRGTDVVLAAAAAARRPLVFASSSEVYGRTSGVPLGEDAARTLGPTQALRWSYATAKTCGEVALLGYVRERGADMRSVRLFNTVGPRQSAEHGMVLPRFVTQALSGRRLTVYGDGLQRRCFVHVDDVVEAFLRVDAAPQAAGQILNVGSTESVSIRDLAERVIAATGSRSRLAFVPFDAVYGADFEEPLDRRPDTAAIRELTAWRPARTLDDAVRDVIRDLGARRDARDAA